jgi:serine protease Do
VEAGTPADKAGLEAGDIITKFNGQTIEKAQDLPRLVAGTKPGTRTTLQVFRRGAYKDLSITVAELDAAQQPKAESQAPAKLAADSLGLSLADLTAAQKRDLRLNGGVMVEAATGPAARAGLRQGDVILAVANVQVADTRQFEGMLAKVDKSRPLSVLVRRGEWAQYVVIRPQAR